MIKYQKYPSSKMAVELLYQSYKISFISSFCFFYRPKPDLPYRDTTL